MIDWLDTTLIIGPRVVLCLSREDYLEAVASIDGEADKHWLMEGRAAVFWFSHVPGEAICVVTMDVQEHDDPIDLAGRLVHEATHCWQYYCEHIGEHKPSNEFMAYGIQNIAVKLMRSFNKQVNGVQDEN